MAEYRFKLEPLGPLCTPLQADTMFGHLCWAVSYYGWEEGKTGKNAVADFLAPFIAGNPTFYVSDGYPRDLLPMPLLDPDWIADLEKSNPDAWRTHSKSFKRKTLIPWSEWSQLAETKTPASVVGGIFSRVVNEIEKPDKGDSGRLPDRKSAVTLKNSINRITSMTGDTGGLYSLEETFFNREDDSGFYLSIYVRADESVISKVKRLLEFVGMSGYGKKKTIGKGAFNVIDCQPVDHLGYEKGRFITLAPFVDEAGTIVPAASRYDLRMKIGKVSESISKPGQPFAKKPIAFYTPGSVFEPANGSRIFGGCIEKIVPNGDGILGDVVQYAYAFPVGVEKL